MKHHIVIAGSGFSGTWSAISAARAVALVGKEGEVGITVVSPTANLVIRPRLYEAVIDNVAPDIKPLLGAIGVRHMAGTVTEVRTEAHQVSLTCSDGSSTLLDYDRFILAAGSQLYMPPVPGLKEHAFSIDQLGDAQALGAHLDTLASRPETLARNTVVIAGGGLTGIEAAADMPERLRTILGP